MNSKQRRQRRRLVTRIVNALVDSVEEMLTEIIEGKKTPEHHLNQCSELRKDLSDAGAGR